MLPQRAERCLGDFIRLSVSGEGVEFSWGESSYTPHAPGLSAGCSISAHGSLPPFWIECRVQLLHVVLRRHSHFALRTLFWGIRCKVSAVILWASETRQRTKEKGVRLFIQILGFFLDCVALHMGSLFPCLQPLLLSRFSPTLCDPIDSSPPGSPVPGILQARTLEWVAISFSNAWKWKVKVKSLSRVLLFATPWNAAYQALPSMGFSRQEYWSGLPLPSPTRY